MENQDWEDGVAARRPEPLDNTWRGRVRDNCRHPGDGSGTISTNPRRSRFEQPEAITAVRSPSCEISATIRHWWCHVLTNHDKRVGAKLRMLNNSSKNVTPQQSLMLCKPSRFQRSFRQAAAAAWHGTSTGTKIAGLRRSRTLSQGPTLQSLGYEVMANQANRIGVRLSIRSSRHAQGICRPWERRKN